MYHQNIIQSLSWPESVRMKPGLYIGGTDERALNSCLMELVANSIEQHIPGKCSSIVVTIHNDGSATAKDDGPGISVAPVPQLDNIPYIELALTKFNYISEHTRECGYRIGLAGVGVPCVNAVSESMLVNTFTAGEQFQIEFARGKVKKPLKKCSAPKTGGGTTIRFKPDPEIFGGKTFDRDALTRALEQSAMLHPGLDVWFVDERPNTLNRALVSHYLFPNGSADYLRLILPKETAIHPREPVQIAGEDAGVKVRVAFQFNESINTWILSFVNSSQTPRDGTHVAAFLRGLTDAVNEFVGVRRRFQPHEVRVGLSAIVSVWLADPKYAGAMKCELINPEVETVVRKLTFEKVRAWIAEIQGDDDWFIERLDEQRSPSFGMGSD